MIARTTPFSAQPRQVSSRCRFPAPLRKSVHTDNGWIDVEWPPGERQAYEEKVLGKPQITRFTAV